MPHKRQEKFPENQCITSWEYLLSARERRFKGPDELLNSGGQFRGCIAQSNGNRMKNHPFRHCLPHCLTKCLRPKRPTLSLQKHFWPPKQNKRMKNGTALFYKMPEAKKTNTFIEKALLASKTLTKNHTKKRNAQRCLTK